MQIIFNEKKYPELIGLPPKTVNIMLHEAMKEFLCSEKGKLYCEGLAYPSGFKREIKRELINRNKYE